jgi:hypothetical protein
MNERTLTPPMQGPARFQRPDDGPRRRPLAVLGAALALVALVAGVPAGLVALAGPPPLPTGLPDRADLTQPIGTDLLLTVLLVVVWLAWALFVVSVVVEVASALRGGGLPRHVPFAGPAQTLARVLVGALLIGGTVVGPGASAAQQVAADAPVAAAVADRPGDERAGRRETDAEANPAGVAAPFSDVAGLAGKRVYVVAAPRDGYHDNLWDIAERHLGDGRRYKEIYRLNEGREQPDGRTLELARLIQPGWNLVMPEDAVGVPRVQAGGEQADPRPGGPAHAAGDAGADQGATDATGEEEGADTGMSPSVIGALSGAGLVSAGVLTALALRRRRRRGTDPDGDAADTEVRLRAAATPDRSQWFLTALRDLGQASLAARTAPPSVYAAVLDDDAVELWLAPANQDPVGDWEALDEGRRWRRRRTPDVSGRGGFAPYPAMVSLGVDDRGRDVLVDLEAAGGPVAVDGDSVVAAEVAAAIAVQLGTSPWSGDLRVTATDVPDLVAGIGDGRITVVDDLTPVLPGLEASYADFTTDVLHGRMARRAGVVPHFVVCGSRPEPEVTDRLHALVGASRQAFGTVCVGTSDSARWTLRVDEAGTLSMPLMDISVVANRLNDAEVRHIAALFAATRDAVGDGLAEGRPPVPQPRRDVDDAAWTTADVRVGVLGQLDVRTPDTPDSPSPERLALASEIVTFLALHPNGVHPNVLAGAVWPKGVTDEVRDSNIERVRAWLGQDRGGDLHLREDESGRLLLGPDVVVDWHCLCGLLRRSRAASSLEAERDLLTRALRLVRGPLLAGHEEQRYSWLARTHLERTVAAVVTDAAHRLAEILRDDDPSGAGAAAEAGLRLEPTCLLLWRDLLSSQYGRDGAAGAQRVLDDMGTTLEEYAVPTDPETDALIEELIPGQGFLPRTS